MFGRLNSCRFCDVRTEPRIDVAQTQLGRLSVAIDKQRCRELECLEAELMGNIPQQGFKAASTEGPYRDEMESLADSIRKPEEMLAGAKNQSR
jgi:hypothetical protein